MTLDRLAPGDFFLFDLPMGFWTLPFPRNAMLIFSRRLGELPFSKYVMKEQMIFFSSSAVIISARTKTTRSSVKHSHVTRQFKS